MKLSTIFAALAATVIAAASCGVLGGTSSTSTASTGTTAAPATATTTSSAAYTNGTTSGTALRNLYVQYQAEGKLNLTNPSNLLNIASLTSSLSGLKGQEEGKAYYKDFAKGLIAGSVNLVTTDNSSAVMSQLGTLANTDLSGIGNILTTASSTASQQQSTTSTGTASEKVNQAATAITSILGIFGK